MPQPRRQYKIIQDGMTGYYLIHISIVRNHGCHCRWKFDDIKELESNPCGVNLRGDRGTATPWSLTTLVSFSVRLQMGLFQKGNRSHVWYDLYGFVQSAGSPCPTLLAYHYRSSCLLWSMWQTPIMAIAIQVARSPHARPITCCCLVSTRQSNDFKLVNGSLWNILKNY